MKRIYLKMDAVTLPYQYTSVPSSVILGLLACHLSPMPLRNCVHHKIFTITQQQDVLVVVVVMTQGVQQGHLIHRHVQIINQPAKVTVSLKKDLKLNHIGKRDQNTIMHSSSNNVQLTHGQKCYPHPQRSHLLTGHRVFRDHHTIFIQGHLMVVCLHSTNPIYTMG